MEQEEKIAHVEKLLIGKWIDERTDLFFNGTQTTGGIGEVHIGPVNMKQPGICRYRVWINADGKPCLAIIKETEQEFLISRINATLLQLVNLKGVQFAYGKP